MKRTAIQIERKFKPTIENPYGYIYITTNIINHKQYLGQHHINSEGNYLGSGVLLQKAIKKYGKKNFISEPIDWAESKEELDQKEIWWIKYLCSNLYKETWYNISEGGNSIGSGENHPLFNTKVSETTKRKMSESHKGSKHPLYGKKGTDNPNYGKHHSKSTRKKMSQSQSFNPPFSGKHHSEETKQKLRESRNQYYKQLKKTYKEV